jgi:hypothetical protein
MNRYMKTCMCLLMELKSVYLNFDDTTHRGNCIICGQTLVIDENCIELVDPHPG